MEARPRHRAYHHVQMGRRRGTCRHASINDTNVADRASVVLVEHYCDWYGPMSPLEASRRRPRGRSANLSPKRGSRSKEASGPGPMSLLEESQLRPLGPSA